MINRISEKNINTKEYLDEQYKNFVVDKDIHNRLEQLVERCGEHENVLDMGCSTGEFLRLYRQKYPNSELYGCDLSSEAIKNCEPKTCLQTDIYRTPYISGRFDLVTCSEVLEHLERPQDAINEMKRALKVGGILIITTPNETDGACDEHLWRWDMEGVKSLLDGFEILEEDNNFYSEHIMLLKCKKLA